MSECRFCGDWCFAGEGLLHNCSLEVQLTTVQASDVLPSTLTAWHVPPPCHGPVVDVPSAGRLGLAVNTLCVSSPCDGRGCNLTMSLPQARQYTIKVWWWTTGGWIREGCQGWGPWEIHAVTWATGLLLHANIWTVWHCGGAFEQRSNP